MQQMYYERAKGKEIITDTGYINVTTPGLRRYFTEINKSLLSDPIDLCTQMINLAKIWKKVSSYPVMQVLLKFNDNTKLISCKLFLSFQRGRYNRRNNNTNSHLHTKAIHYFRVSGHWLFKQLVQDVSLWRRSKAGRQQYNK